MHPHATKPYLVIKNQSQMKYGMENAGKPFARSKSIYLYRFLAHDVNTAVPGGKLQSST